MQNPTAPTDTGYRQWITSLKSSKLLKEGGVHLIDLPVDYSENVKYLITDLDITSPLFDDAKHNRRL